MEKGKAILEEMKSSEQSPNSEYSTPSATSFQSDSRPMEIPRELIYCELIQKKHQDMLLRYNNCFVCLQEAFSDVNLLREENLKLRAENLDLSILVTTKENEIMPLFSSCSGDIVSDFRRLGFTGNGESERDVSVVRLPQAVNMNQKSGGKSLSEEERTETGAGRGVLPKVISIRSNGYLAVNNNSHASGPSSAKGAGSSGANRPHRLRLVAKPAQGGEEASGIELEVYNQGMLKTELCNKWEETGACPYGDRCQFAHGIQELRPVIRHPRYKTEICRMISSGGTCPYGHRCHFRHSFDPNEEKEVVL